MLENQRQDNYFKRYQESFVAGCYENTDLRPRVCLETTVADMKLET